MGKFGKSQRLALTRAADCSLQNLMGKYMGATKSLFEEVDRSDLAHRAAQGGVVVHLFFGDHIGNLVKGVHRCVSLVRCGPGRGRGAVSQRWWSYYFIYPPGSPLLGCH